MFPPFSSSFTFYPLIYRAAALSFITLSPHISPTFLAFSLQPSLLCLSGLSRLLPWLDFASVIFFFCVTAGRLFFRLVVIGLDYRRSN